MREQEGRLRQMGVVVAVVTFDANFMAQAYVEQTGLVWPLLIDADRSLYRAYGMERGGWWSIYGPSSVWHYLKLIMGGRWLQSPGKDYRQLGGDILIDPDGIVRLHFVSDSPHDRPSVESLLAAISTDEAR